LLRNINGLSFRQNEKASSVLVASERENIRTP
jgi:hypothetical protein